MLSVASLNEGFFGNSDERHGVDHMCMIRHQNYWTWIPGHGSYSVASGWM
jgi:hypothetical protein